MVDPDEVEKEIISLESRDTTYAVCERLAWLYIVRDHLNGVAQNTTAKAAYVEPETTGELGESEFLRAASGKPIDEVMRVMDEYMATLHIVSPRAYDSIMSKLAEI